MTHHSPFPSPQYRPMTQIGITETTQRSPLSSEQFSDSLPDNRMYGYRQKAVLYTSKHSHKISLVHPKAEAVVVLQERRNWVLEPPSHTAHSCKKHTKPAATTSNGTEKRKKKKKKFSVCVRRKTAHGMIHGSDTLVLVCESFGCCGRCGNFAFWIFCAV